MRLPAADPEDVLLDHFWTPTYGIHLSLSPTTSLDRRHPPHGPLARWSNCAYTCSLDPTLSPYYPGRCVCLGSTALSERQWSPRRGDARLKSQESMHRVCERFPGTRLCTGQVHWTDLSRACKRRTGAPYWTTSFQVPTLALLSCVCLHWCLLGVDALVRASCQPGGGWGHPSSPRRRFSKVGVDETLRRRSRCLASTSRFVVYACALPTELHCADCVSVVSRPKGASPSVVDRERGGQSSRRKQAARHRGSRSSLQIASLRLGSGPDSPRYPRIEAFSQVTWEPSLVRAVPSPSSLSSLPLPPSSTSAMSLNSQDEKVDIHQKESASFEESHVDTAFERATMYVLVV